MADEDMRAGDPDKARKKKAPPPDDEDDDRPRKKRRSDDDDDDDDAPKKKKKIAKDDDDNDLGSSPLSALIPVGGSVFALLSLWLSVISGLMGLAGWILLDDKALIAVLPALWPISLLCGVLAFFTHKHKASYGSITGNMRAIMGILISLVVMLMHGVFVFMYFAK